MVFFPTMALAGQMSLATTAATTALTSLTANAAKDFFMQVFLNPGGNIPGVIIVCVLVAGPLIGLAFLVKLIYGKCSPKKL